MKNFYDAEKAYIRAHETVSGSRSGLCVAEQEIVRLNQLLSPLVQQGQSLHQIYIHHQAERSEKIIYNYIDACLFDVRNIDLPRKVRFRERYKRPEFKVDKSCSVGRNKELFPIILTDNGSEFSNPKAIEEPNRILGLRTRVFFAMQESRIKREPLR